VTRSQLPFVGAVEQVLAIAKQGRVLIHPVVQRCAWKRYEPEEVDFHDRMQFRGFDRLLHVVDGLARNAIDEQQCDIEIEVAG
jgi:hypothetical protein